MVNARVLVTRAVSCTMAIGCLVFLVPSAATTDDRGGSSVPCAVAAVADEPGDARHIAQKPTAKPMDCEKAASSYQASCLKACIKLPLARRAQCEAPCNDPKELRLRRTQCEKQRS